MRKVDAIHQGRVAHGGREMLMLAGNNYLGLAGAPRLGERAVEAIREWGNSTSGSRLLNGTIELHRRLEARLAEFKRVQPALVLQSGYMANVGVLSALLGPGDVMIADKLAHASLIDGCTLAGATLRTFRHQGIDSLTRVLAGLPAATPKLVVDGIYSMDGDFAKLPEVLAVARRFGARVMVDDAHATGIAGPAGRGTADHFGVDEPDVVTGTLSKAFGGIGGFVGVTREIAEFLQYNSRAFIYSTSLPPAATAALLVAVSVVEGEPERRQRLWACTRHLLDGLRRLGYDTGVSESPIVPIILGDETRMLMLVEGLHRDDIFASPVIYPACPRNAPRVRLSLCADHDLADIDRLLDSHARHGRALGLID